MNRKNFKLVLDQIQNHPETWDQEHWHCDTIHCFAGWAQILSGEEASDCLVSVHARKFLGITKDQGEWLFNANRNLADFESFLADGFWLPDGYNRLGYDRDGFYRSGYNENGFHRSGYDRLGFDQNGYNRDGMERAK